MKYVILALTFLELATASVSGASTLNCAVGNVVRGRPTVDATIAVVDIVEAACRDENGFRLPVSIRGLGLGLKVAAETRFRIDCSSDGEDMIGSYVGLKADAAFLVGAGAAVYVGDGGICSMADGSLLSIGADASISNLDIGRFRRY